MVQTEGFAGLEEERGAYGISTFEQSGKLQVLYDPSIRSVSDLSRLFMAPKD